METKKDRIYLCLARMGGNEMRFVQEAFDANWVAPLGPNVDAFEQELSSYWGGRKQVACLSSGTAALHLALRMCGVSSGDYVICQSFTFCASANPITYLGATPLFVDSEEESWNMDPKLLVFAIEETLRLYGKKPKAIVFAHLYGMPAKCAEIVSIAKAYSIPLVEDAAEALGSDYKGEKCGTIGDYGVLSFNGNKMITTSGGGALVCPDEATKKAVLKLATQSKEPYPFYQHEQIGYNYRMSNICAGIGRGQMEVLTDHVAHHRHVAEMYREMFSEDERIRYHETKDDSGHSNCWLSTILLSENVRIRDQERVPDYGTMSPNRNVEALRVQLDRANVETRPLWKPLHLQPVYASCRAFCNGVSERLFQQGLCLPSGPLVTDEDVKYIVEAIKVSME